MMPHKIEMQSTQLLSPAKTIEEIEEARLIMPPTKVRKAAIVTKPCRTMLRR